ncbi:MAG: FAD-dependent 5-carboxymethylaminomethyl-2-thiouridine(34) oxidoreductase MnmC [Massilia sp.]|nr:FAD-dependent 5-carboxymethylaminomethyl-2-thiouridine(34) oxidoreductase MnmC [Massilia sp.]
MDFRAAWRGRERFVIFDAHWGEGAAFAAWVDAWRNDPLRPARLHVIACAPVQAPALPGFQRRLLPDGALTLDLLHAPLDMALDQLAARIDAVYLHGVGEADSGFARALARLLAPDATLHAPDLSAAHTAALAATGWRFDSAQTARFASRKRFAPVAPAPKRRAVVIGAGLAGAAACERLCARGWQVTLVERHHEAAMEASGNLAGISMPLLSKDDNLASRLSRAAYLFAQAYWERVGGIGAAIDGASCGVLWLAKDAVHARLQQATAVARQFPPAYAEWFDGAAASARFGRLAADGAWLFPQGGWIRPASACQAMLGACGPGLGRRFGVGSVSLERDGDGDGDDSGVGASGEWRVRDARGVLIAQAPIVILANGAGATDLAQARGLPLVRVRGQVTHLAPDALPDLGLVLCRETYVTPASSGLRSAGATYDDDFEPELRASSQRENLDKVASMLGDGAIGQGAPLLGRVGFRSVATDRLPLVGALPDPAFAPGAERLSGLPRQGGLYALLGYASRGLTWAPLAAELLAASLEGEPLPLETALAAALDPGGFQLRGRRGAR